MKNKQFLQVFKKRLWYRYRVFRRGMIVLPYLESNLVLELEKLYEVHVPISKVPVELEYFINSLRTIRREIKKTYQALALVKRTFKGRKISEEDFEKIVAEQLKDTPNKQDILVRIKSFGGVNGFIEHILSFLRPRYDKYSECIDLINKYYETNNESITLSELTLKIGDSIPCSPDVMYKICWNPLSCIVVAVIIVGTLLLAEGEAGGEEEEETSEPGDFPEPDPDGPTPV